MVAHTSLSRLDSGSLDLRTNWSLTVAVVHDREISRRGIRDMLDEIPGVSHVEAVDSTKARSLGAADVVIIASDLAEEEITSIIRSRTSRYVVLTRGRIPKWAAFVPRLTLIKEEELTQSMLLAILRDSRSVKSVGDLSTHKFAERSEWLWWPKLTKRESETLALLAEGMTNRQIAAALGISQHGVKRLVASVLAKLNAPNRTTAVARAMREGLLEPSPAV